MLTQFRQVLLQMHRVRQDLLLKKFKKLSALGIRALLLKPEQPAYA
ncbi:hypothetical protein DSM107010_72520 [Chroococcidiopsis cubana SAG 39.79]|uniref:Uncharacterized protein n=1 Tax=Chroococcidiopsis cubana SAG 39.79 TaxID=388085 RepID=A0AB37U8C9_9CYAN|nr:hypothetical protein DSM107010_72520 [Chroococcidiopsis cubana SAG 39.79]